MDTKNIGDQPTVCALCDNERILCDSHIIPEFMYRPGYDELGRNIRVEAETGRRKYVQKGYTEPLLCKECEGFLNESYEQPFQRSWYEEELLPSIPSSAKAARLTGINYKPFKLFHLSVLWRAAVATGPAFRPTNLGPHEEPIRQMVLNGQPGEPDEYPVMGIALTHEGELAHGLIMSPAVWKHEAMRIYSMVYGGFEWGIGVASHCSPHMRNLAVTKDGQMKALVTEWTESPFIRGVWSENVARRNASEGGIESGS